MKALSPEELQKWKDTFAKDGIIYNSDNEYREAVHNLVGYVELLIEMDQQQKAAKKPNSKES
jgi:hypothetical protein